MSHLQQLAQQVVEMALRNGATAAECIIREGKEFSTTIRCGEIEQLKEAQSKAMGLRVFLGCRTAGAYTSDFSRQGIEQLVSRALAASRVTSEDPYAGLSDPSLVGKHPGELELYHEDVVGLSSAFMIEQA
ncbi:MAG: TldD/PmbA family protein, partial [Acidobacteria bacterium]|nr:TldD/PmbA family protein [Acidobacteriota bacterium]